MCTSAGSSAHQNHRRDQNVSLYKLLFAAFGFNLLLPVSFTSPKKEKNLEMENEKRLIRHIVHPNPT